MSPSEKTIVESVSSFFSNSQHCQWLGSKEANAKYSLTTFNNALNLAGALVVTCRERIAELLSLANKLKFCILPLSSNRNWGYGAMPSFQDRPIVVLDLSQMKSIVPTSKSLGLITVEPGVTQQDLRDYFDLNNWDYLVPVTGAGPNCSIVSNALERGYGITPHTDHFQACTALKAYLPHPDLCNEEYSSAVSVQDTTGSDFIDKTFKWGVGPYIDGLFTQSNMGIVTEMTFRLAKSPSAFCAFYIQVFKDDKFSACVNFIKHILQQHAGSIGSINLMDRRRLLSMTVDNPNIHKDENTYLSDEQIQRLAKQNRTPHWLIVGSIYGIKPVMQAIKKDVKQNGKHLGQILFSDSSLLTVAKTFLKPPLLHIPFLSDIRKQLDTLDEGIDIMMGKPNQVALPLAYWRNRTVRPDKSKELHPANDRCGLLWYAPLVQMDADKLSHFVSFVRSTIQSFDLDPFITFTNLRHDCIDSTVPIVFNANSEEETKRAKQCLSTLINEGVKFGYVPYRLSTEEQQALSKQTPFWQSVNLIKQAFDPNNVISPGRYS